jgi:hypothetical protein
VGEAAGTAGLLGQMEGRTASAVAGWLAAQPDSWRNGITHVTIDLSDCYVRAVSDPRGQACSRQRHRRLCHTSRTGTSPYGRSRGRVTS